MYDVIIVGARCGGAATAMLLARRGLRVLAVDRATFPSDTLSTHQIQVPGVAALDRWGLLDRLLAAGAAPTRSVRFQAGAHVLTGTMPTVGGVDFALSARRPLLDATLVDAARAAGAEVREDFAVAEIVTDGGRVVGVRGATRSGPPVVERAPLVVGADGRRSLVARTVGAADYRTVPGRSMAYYTYFDGVPTAGGEMYAVPGRAVGLWPTTDGQVMAYVAGPVAEFAAFRADVEGNFMATLDAVGVGPRYRAGRRTGRLRGTPDLPAFIRRPYGPGWALVGDAGLSLDPITGLGIGWAFRDAELLADAVVTGRMRAYHRARDRAARPLYDFTARLAALAPPTPGEDALFAALAADPVRTRLFFAALSGAVPLARFMSPATIIPLVGLRGMIRLVTGSRRVPAVS